ncbi:helix-turn-helix transcriptional regulator [Acidaminobacter sp. JC074]|uniref:helix-turn-helix domain-containing protein n=1 Tax=Acidaminobacter sp. JC074 TaxID=2530199 RepID=UPI001F0D25BC|nr:helix-turn-helix transcriptional regulator [Acidaminobacter sp. JC074]MCH4888372.1 helix-turn-helix transcriptional regulator [Acidaminobacter sp. JC074]
MILADKIIKLRKQSSWSQEELADKMNVSRQSVSKWENASSIPDLNKILLMAEIFGVSTDYLLKDDIEDVQGVQKDYEPDVWKVTLEEANDYVETKLEMNRLNARGALICIYSIIPLMFFLGLASQGILGITENMALIIGMTSLLLMIVIGVSIFIRSSQLKTDIIKIEEETFELSYGVDSIFKEKAKAFRNVYSQKISIGVGLIIMSFMPLMISAMLGQNGLVILSMLCLMLIVVGIGVYILVPASIENSAYNCLLSQGEYAPNKKKETRRIEQFATFYWPLVTAIYIGWSLFTMNWGVTWIVWPVAGILFAALVGLIGFLESNKEMNHE